MSRITLLGLILISSQASALPPLDPEDPGNDAPPPTLHQACTEAIAQKQQQLASSGIQLGKKVGSLAVYANYWCAQAFTNGRVHATASGPATAVYGVVLAKYAALGYEPGFGRAFRDPETQPTGATMSQFSKGYVVVHPYYGARAIRSPLSGLWSANDTAARFGYPVTEQLSSSLASSYSILERGYLARTNELGEWIDFTGNGEGKVSAEVALFASTGLTGSSLVRGLVGESPIAVRAQLGSFDNQTSSLTVSMPTRTSLYLYDLSPLSGRFLRITGADNSTIRVSNIGSWIDDRVSSMMFVNHGTASAKLSRSTLAGQIEDALDNLDTATLLANALQGYGATGTLTWNSGVTLNFHPDDRTFEFSRRAYLDINGPLWTDADGDIEVRVTLRPYIARAPSSVNATQRINSVHTWFIDGAATSLSCGGSNCDERASALAAMFETSSTQILVERMFDQAFDAQLAATNGICGADGPRRVNLLPDALEVVVADTTAVAACLASFASMGQLDFSRPVARVTNGGEPSLFPPFIPPFNGTVSVVPKTQLPPVFE